MIVKQYIKTFESYGFGLFVHFGLYSLVGKGEWAHMLCGIPKDEYESLAQSFNPEPDWADELVQSAKNAGCRYITITARHHDGFSLYDTCGLNEYDAPHAACGRDLIKEFTEACRKYGIVPFFYHTLLDWHNEDYKKDFKKYLIYLRNSITLLCTNYGHIGGIWFDGMWDKPNEDWEEDSLYGLIRSLQPEAMIINNTGLSKLGELGHIELDSVTFERGIPSPINLSDSPKYIASEMCEVLNRHWGYAQDDLNYKSVPEIIETLCVCRRYGSNLLLNVGPMGSGFLRLIDKGMLEEIGKWTEIHNAAIRKARPSGINVDNKEKDFILKDDGALYLFQHDLPMVADPNVALMGEASHDHFTFDRKINSIRYLDDASDVPFSQDGDKIDVKAVPFVYGRSMVVRVAEIKYSEELL